MTIADLRGLALPSSSEELWRYSRIGSLDLSRYSRIVDQALGKQLPGGQSSAAPERLIPADRDLFAAAVAASATTTVVRVNANEVVSNPIALANSLDSSHDGSVVVSRAVIDVGANAQATIIHQVSSPDIDALFIPEVEIRIGAGANVRYIVVQELGPRVIQVASQSSLTMRDATFSSMAVALGGSYARLRIDSTIAERGGHNELLAAYFASDEQMHDFRTIQDHVAPKTTSDLVFKGAVSGRARSVYSGLIRIGADARGTSANQTNRNLLLSPDASAESVPNLEIENNDVKCSHASAIGPISEDERYYLESRGVPPAIADRLIVLGFFDETLSRIPNAEMRARLIHTIASTLDSAKGRS